MPWNRRSKPVRPLAEQLAVQRPCTIGADGLKPVSRSCSVCAACRKPVVNVSELTELEARLLVRLTGGTFCRQLKLRSDGSIVFRQPKAMRAVRKRVGELVASSSAMLFSVSTVPDAKRSAPIVAVEHVPKAEAAITSTDVAGEPTSAELPVSALNAGTILTTLNMQGGGPIGSETEVDDDVYSALYPMWSRLAEILTDPDIPRLLKSAVPLAAVVVTLFALSYILCMRIAHLVALRPLQSLRDRVMGARNRRRAVSSPQEISSLRAFLSREPRGR